MCALLGVFILTLPLPIVVNSFSSIYKNRSEVTHRKLIYCCLSHRLWRNEVAQKKSGRYTISKSYQNALVIY